MTITHRHRSWRGPALLLIGLLAAGTPPAARGQSGEWSDEPPGPFRKALAEASGPLPATRADALARLGAEPKWEPYLRAALNRATDQKVRDTLREALLKCQEKLFEWNLERAKTWAEELHFDYLADLARSTDDTKRAEAIADLVIAAQRAVHDKYKGLGPYKDYQQPPPGHSFLTNRVTRIADLYKLPTYRRFPGDRVTVPGDLVVAFVHATSGTIEPTGGGSWICLSRDQLREADARSGHRWSRSVVVVNGPALFAKGSESLLVCDGDVELGQPDDLASGFDKSVVIANGQVTLHGGCPLGFSAVYAAGDFLGPSALVEDKYLGVLAGGKNTVMGEKGHPGNKYKAQGLKENPFGVKFVSPADAGVELDVGEKVVRLGALKESSPLAKVDLRKGDRVLSVNGMPVETAADVRRQLRESLLWGTGLFEVKRGDHTFTRLVKFAEPPKK